MVVGSGFGGSVISYRLASAKENVAVLERGQAYKPGDFTRTVHEVSDSFWDPSNKLYGRFNVWFFKKLGALVCSGLGGGSLIYANVLIRKPKEWFAAEENWPITYDDLAKHYDAVEAILKPEEYPSGEHYDVPKVKAFRAAAQALADRDTTLKLDKHLKLGIAFAPDKPLGSPIASVNMHGVERRSCTLCGDCVVGCNVGAKSTLDFNYLSLAKAAGASIYTSCEVREFRPIPGGKIEVSYVLHDPTDQTTSEVYTLQCKRLVLSAGTFGSTYLMMKNAKNFAAQPALGTRFSSNGDQLAFAINCTEPVNAMRGPTITTALRGSDPLDPNSTSTTRGFYLEDAGFPHELSWLIAGFSLGGWLTRGVRFARQMFRKMWFSDPDSDFGEELHELLGDAKLSRHFMPLLAMGRDYADGTFSLTPKLDPENPEARTFLALDWNGTRSAEYFDRVTSVSRDLTEELGGKFIRHIPTALFSREITVHPLGGCPMGTDPTTSVVDSYGKSHVHDGLFVVDGSILPASVGPNPSLTIAAVANRAADNMLGIA